MNSVQIAYFLDLATGQYHGTCPSTEGRLLDTYAARLGQFRQSWEAPSRLHQSSRRHVALDELRQRASVLPGYVLGSPYAEGVRLAYRAVGRASEALPKPSTQASAPGYSTLLLLCIGHAVFQPPAYGGPRWTISGYPTPAGDNTLWWASADDVLWVSDGVTPARAESFHRPCLALNPGHPHCMHGHSDDCPDSGTCATFPYVEVPAPSIA